LPTSERLFNSDEKSRYYEQPLRGNLILRTLCLFRSTYMLIIRHAAAVSSPSPSGSKTQGRRRWREKWATFLRRTLYS
jgi:hypothetical protein